MSAVLGRPVRWMPRSATLQRASRNAPVEPPCFASHEAWVEYLAHAHDAAEPGVVPFVRGGGVDAGFNFCTDCWAPAREGMRQAGRCWPQWLQLLAEIEKAEAEAAQAVEQNAC